MSIYSVRDIPDEVKYTIELLYAGKPGLAHDEALNLRAKRGDLGMLLDCVLKIFESPPDKLDDFYRELLQNYRLSCQEDELRFDISNLMGDAPQPTSASQHSGLHAVYPQSYSGLRPHPLRMGETQAQANQKYDPNAETQLPFASAELPSVYSSSQLNKLQPTFDIDIDLNPEHSQHRSQQHKLQQLQLDELARRQANAKNYQTPAPRAPISAKSNVPSIVRAATVQAQDNRNPKSNSDLFSVRHSSGSHPPIRRSVHGIQAISPNDDHTPVHYESGLLRVDPILYLEPLERIPKVSRAANDILQNLRLDAKLTHIFSLIDNQSSLQRIIQNAKISDHDAAQALFQLLSRKLIYFDD